MSTKEFARVERSKNAGSIDSVWRESSTALTGAVLADPELAALDAGLRRLQDSRAGDQAKVIVIDDYANQYVERLVDGNDDVAALNKQIEKDYIAIESAGLRSQVADLAEARIGALRDARLWEIEGDVFGRLHEKITELIKTARDEGLDLRLLDWGHVSATGRTDDRERAEQLAAQYADVRRGQITLFRALEGRTREAVPAHFNIAASLGNPLEICEFYGAVSTDSAVRDNQTGVVAVPAYPWPMLGGDAVTEFLWFVDTVEAEAWVPQRRQLNNVMARLGSAHVAAHNEREREYGEAIRQGGTTEQPQDGYSVVRRAVELIQ